jgi:hypothetical protein
LCGFILNKTRLTTPSGDVPSEQKQLKELHPSDAPSKAPLQDTIGNSPKKQKQKKVSDEEREKWEKRYESTDTLVCALKERAERQAENVGSKFVIV